MKIKPENITGVTAKFFHPDDRAPYPVSWRVNVSPRSESRTFESYGKNAMDYEYPIEKLPKAVQEFLETAVAGRPLRNGNTSLVSYEGKLR